MFVNQRLYPIWERPLLPTEAFHFKAGHSSHDICASNILPWSNCGIKQGAEVFIGGITIGIKGVSEAIIAWNLFPWGLNLEEICGHVWALTFIYGWNTKFGHFIIGSNFNQGESDISISIRISVRLFMVQIFYTPMRWLYLDTRFAEALPTIIPMLPLSSHANNSGRVVLDCPLLLELTLSSFLGHICYNSYNLCDSQQVTHT